MTTILAVIVSASIGVILTVARLTRRHRTPRPVCTHCRSRRCAGQRLSLAAETRAVRLRGWTAPADASALTATAGE